MAQPVATGTLEPVGVTRARVLATPSHECGLPSQHHPNLGALPETHNAGTRRSARRERDSMKQAFFSRTEGGAERRRCPPGSSAACGPPEDHRQRVVRRDTAELLATLDIDQGIYGGGRRRCRRPRRLGPWIR